jgi:hypothetical protein
LYRSPHVVLFVAGALGGFGCQHDIHTGFPEGIEPLEPNPIPEPSSGPYTETIALQADDTGYIHVYGRGFVLADPATVWAAAKNPPAIIAVCSTDQQTVTVGDEPQYEYSFQVGYSVQELVTVTWDDDWRFAVIDGSDADYDLAMIAHQKVDGSSFITRSEGTVTFTPPADGTPNVTELSYVEHLDSVGGDDAAVEENMQHSFDSIVSLAHGGQIVSCQ